MLDIVVVGVSEGVSVGVKESVCVGVRVWLCDPVRVREELGLELWVCVSDGMNVNEVVSDSVGDCVNVGV